MDNLRICLQLFADTAQGDTAGPAPRQTSGEEEASAAGMQETGEAPQADPREEFERLIRGPYKQLYDARMQDTIRRRLKQQTEAVERLEAIEPVLRLLGERYGLENPDPKGLLEAITAEAPRPEAVRDLEESWQRQEESLRQLYPGFSLAKELEDPRFRQLLRGRVDMATAFEVCHKDQLIPAAMAYAARAVQQKLSRSLASGGGRPGENGLEPRSAAVVKEDVSRLSGSQIADIARRVARGERISFG